MNNDQIKVMFATEEHVKYAQQIVDLIYESALQRGTGIARRSISPRRFRAVRPWWLSVTTV